MRTEEIVINFPFRRRPKEEHRRRIERVSGVQILAAICVNYVPQHREEEKEMSLVGEKLISFLDLFEPTGIIHPMKPV